MAKAAFLDRDGVINRKAPEGSYITRWEQFEFLPGIAESIAVLKAVGFTVIVITNQRCVAKGLMTIAELGDMHRRMSEALARAGASLDGIYYCPHELEPACRCRKPAPGMLLDAARERGIDLSASWMIGDSEIDVEAGRNAGCKTARLLDEADAAGLTWAESAANGADVVANSLFDAVSKILQAEGITASPLARTGEAAGLSTQVSRR